MLRGLLPDRNPVAEAMVWCIEHADAWEEIVECISEALSIQETPLAKKVARLYLISDILHNCSIKGVPNVSYYRQGFQAKLPEIFGDLKSSHEAVQSRMKAEAFKQRVMSCFRAWEDWALYPQDFLIKLQNIFLGLVRTEGDNEDASQQKEEEDVDGKSMSEDDEDVDGVPLDGAALLKRGGAAAAAVGTPTSSSRRRDSRDSDDVDGTPLQQGNSKPSGGPTPGFVPSKWETVDPDEVQAQAVTSKWDLFDQQEDNNGRRKGITDPEEDDDDDVDGVPMGGDVDSQLDLRLSEDRRARLREVEIKVMTYQDELESGKQEIRPGWTISEQVEQYRKKLLKGRPAPMAAVSQDHHHHLSIPDAPSISLSTASSSLSFSRTPKSRSSHRGDSDDDRDDGERSSSRKSRSSKKKSKKSRHRSSSSSRSRSRYVKW